MSTPWSEMIFRKGESVSEPLACGASSGLIYFPPEWDGWDLGFLVGVGEWEIGKAEPKWVPLFDGETGGLVRIACVKAPGGGCVPVPPAALGSGLMRFVAIGDKGEPTPVAEQRTLRVSLRR